jgi:multiple sugar transport system substrate-binding protein
VRHPFSRPAVLMTTVATALLAAGCTGTPASQSSANANEPVTIKFWHGWSQPHEVAAIQANIKAFEKLHPNITVVSTPNVTDDKLLQGIRSGSGPDVVSSFTTDNVGLFCNGALTDLNPLLQKAGIDKNKVFVKTMVDYTQYKGKQCTLPLLGDAMGLYYNKAMFAAAGITSPPKTWSEFTADAVKLTKPKGDTYSQLGFMPNYHGYNTTPGHYLAQYGATYFTADGKANLADDPAVTTFLKDQQHLVNVLGGYTKLEKYRATFGDEYSTQNAFEAKKVAMQLDGEWRLVNLKQDKVAFPYAAAPMPVADDRADTYGAGYVTGTVAGISATSQHQAAAWEFLKFLTTDTNALVSFANAINNVPSTVAALHSPQLLQDPTFQTFVKIAGNPDSQTTPASPNGGQYQTILADFAYKVEAGKVPDIRAGLRDVDKQIDTATAQAQG